MLLLYRSIRVCKNSMSSLSSLQTLARQANCPFPMFPRSDVCRGAKTQGPRCRMCFTSGNQGVVPQDLGLGCGTPSKWPIFSWLINRGDPNYLQQVLGAHPPSSFTWNSRATVSSYRQGIVGCTPGPTYPYGKSLYKHYIVGYLWIIIPKNP